ncbi:hypothetical protein F2P56_033875 [Juglans regia]|uniref:Pathogen-associated molecular patterns-induced protein A70-like n=2 Tax=Juglans regia TaxID=51240 RepID=A0A2I4GL92_JUGRE|nr:pathogen-associated molecular patterns-induced protein A70-like [Juglans regia]KAF5444770.1 hypothetical protein F2P56_033875 [Juglans regia]
MFEASVSPTPSIWASINSWFTPAVFFVVLNLMIGTIAITSRLGNQKHQQAEAEAEAGAEAEHPQHPQFARSPSVLQRLKSIKFYAYRSQEPANIFEKSPESESHFDFKHLHELEQPQLTRSPSMFQRLKSINLRSYQYHEPSAPQFPTTAITATSDLHKTQEFDIHFTTLQQPLENEEEEQSQEEDEDEDEYKEQDQYQDLTMNEIYGRLQDTHATKPSTPQSPTTAITANATSDLHKNQEFDTHFTTLQQPLENEEEEEEQSQEEGEYKEQDQYADQTMNEIYDRLQGTHATKPKRKMKKSVSAKLAFRHFEEDDIVEARRPATVSEGKVGATEDKEEVDSKADDFINKFKRQLKLQRMDSILRNMAEDHRRQSGE